MGLDELAGCMEVLKKRLQSHRAVLQEKGTRTRMALIDPLLRRDGKPAAIVEAKKLGEVLGSHRMQVLNYANASGISITGTPLFVNVHLSAYGVRQNTKRLLKRCGLNPADVHLHVAQSPKDLLPTDRQTTISPGNDNAGKVQIRALFWNLPSRLQLRSW
jgi:hypothetical protein